MYILRSNILYYFYQFNIAKNNIKKSLSIIENICKKCKNKKIKNIINIGKIIEDTVIMRTKINNDEYIKKNMHRWIR